MASFFERIKRSRLFSKRRSVRNLGPPVENIPKHLRQAACEEYLPAICRFSAGSGFNFFDLCRGIFTESLESHLNHCAACQRVCEWAFSQQFKGINEVSRREGWQADQQDMCYRLRCQFGVAVPIYVDVTSLPQGRLIARAVLAFTDYLVSRNCLPNIRLSLWLEPAHLPRDNAPMAPLRDGVVEINRVNKDYMQETQEGPYRMRCQFALGEPLYIDIGDVEQAEQVSKTLQDFTQDLIDLCYLDDAELNIRLEPTNLGEINWSLNSVVRRSN